MEDKKLDQIIDILNILNNNSVKMQNQFDKMQVQINKMQVQINKMQAQIDKMQVQIDKMETRIDEMQIQIDNLNNKIDESERRQNQKLAVFEHTYGDKINAIFDKIVSMDEKISDLIATCNRHEDKLEKHDEFLFEYNCRISALEEKVVSQ